MSILIFGQWGLERLRLKPTSIYDTGQAPTDRKSIWKSYSPEHDCITILINTNIKLSFINSRKLQKRILQSIKTANLILYCI